MGIRVSFILVFSLSASSFLFGQDSWHQKLFPFDEEQFNERFKEYNLRKQDSLQLKEEMITRNNGDSYAMRWFPVDEQSMADMPRMPIRKDMDYTLRIKKYNRHNPWNPDGLLNRKNLLKPYRIPKE